MDLPDVNVLVYAHREDAERHGEYREWLRNLLAGEAAFAVADAVLSGFVRVVTHPRIFRDPTPLRVALSFARELREAPNAVHVSEGPRHFEIFARLCEAAGARGSLVADAHLAALAIEAGCEWVTADRDFSRFPGLETRHPLG